MKKTQERIQLSELKLEKEKMGTDFLRCTHSIEVLSKKAEKYQDDFPEGFLDVFISEVMHAYSVLGKHGFGPERAKSLAMKKLSRN
jgi:tRNA A-37 threonylcarbamoyl transferase component Bud32